MQKKILIIEDDNLLGDVLAEKIGRIGYEIVRAPNGAIGLQKMREEKPDLVLLDILLPVKNGYEVLEEKAKDPDLAPIPVIIISNSGQPVEISRAFRLGAKDYLVKATFNPDDVLYKIRRELAKEEEKDRGEAGEVSHDAIFHGEKVLLIEDDQFLSDIIARKMQSEGAVFTRVSDGEEAFRLLEKEVPDAILLDILLPIMDGYEILAKLKADPKTSAIPVILFSNLGQKNEIDKGLKLGAVRFIVKVSMTPTEIAEETRKVILETRAEKAMKKSEVMAR